jgi:SAM-dependent methyltransferase
MSDTVKKWPKVLPPLSPQQKEAREKFMLQWQQTLPSYGPLEKFNQGWVTTLPLKAGGKTLEIGAGIGAHLAYEDLSQQEYHCLEYREEWCGHLRKMMPPERVICGDIQRRQAWPDSFFDRIVAIHVLEHLLDLPSALAEIWRLLKDDGTFDVMLPTEGKLAYSLGRKASAERLFRRDFKMDYTPIIRHEHVSTLEEVLVELAKYFKAEKRRHFPFPWLPLSHVNLVMGMRLGKLKAGESK